jgi:Tfp pilus assembly protein PilN
MATSTNLALHPFKNERLPWLLASLLMALALVLSFTHGRAVNRLLSGEEARTVRAVREDEARIAELEKLIAAEPPLRIEASELARLRAFKDLVDRRVFPWRRLLSELEERLPDGIRLTRISPATTREGPGMVIGLAGDARTKDAAFTFAEALGQSPAFREAVLKSLNEGDSVTEFVLDVVFDPSQTKGSLAPLAPNGVMPVMPDRPSVERMP